jgi:hypothetical protein
MPCGCGKKREGTIHFMGNTSTDTPDPIEWGPIVWRYLHCLTEKIGFSGNPIVDIDQANHMETIINNLHLIIPCPECQSHAHSYISNNPLPSLKGLTGDNLRSTIRNWLFIFHNHVREIKAQPIIINTVDECKENYNGCFIKRCEYDLFIQNGAYAVRLGWVKIENWRKWYTTSEKLRITIGNIVL